MKPAEGTSTNEIPLEKNHRFSFHQKICLVGYALLTAPVSIAKTITHLVYGNPEGDQWNPGTIAYEKCRKQSETASGKWLEAFSRYSFDIKNRDRIMADESLAALSQHNSLLINCGSRHVEGIENHLREKLFLRSVNLSALLNEIHFLDKIDSGGNVY